jgi:hypothetical protein
MSLEVKISARTIGVIIAIGFLLATAITVYAYNPSNTPTANPAVFGHSVNEISGIPNCGTNFLSYDANGFYCKRAEYAMAWRNKTGSPASVAIHPLVGSATAFKIPQGLTGQRGLVCNEADGWELTGCWVAGTNTDGVMDNDANGINRAEGNGCASNDFDQMKSAKLYVNCMRFVRV